MDHTRLIDETKNAMLELESQIANHNYDHIVGIALDSNASPDVGLIDTADVEATSEPYRILIDVNDDLGDETLAENIDYDRIIAELKTEWINLGVSAEQLVEKLAKNGYPADVVNDAIHGYDGPGQIRIDDVTYLLSNAEYYISFDLEDWQGDQLTGQEAAEVAGIAWSTWRDYVADGRAPQRDGVLGSTSWWWEITVRRWMLNRPGQGVGGGRPRKG